MDVWMCFVWICDLKGVETELSERAKQMFEVLRGDLREKKKKARRAAEFAYFSSRLPFTKRTKGCALDSATALQSPLRTALACHESLPSLNLTASKAAKPTSWIGMT